jgi:hypothetical protein
MKQGSNAESHVMQPQATTEEGPLDVMLHEGRAVHGWSTVPLTSPSREGI